MSSRIFALFGFVFATFLVLSFAADVSRDDYEVQDDYVTKADNIEVSQLTRYCCGKWNHQCVRWCDAKTNTADDVTQIEDLKVPQLTKYCCGKWNHQCVRWCYAKTITVDDVTKVKNVKVSQLTRYCCGKWNHQCVRWCDAITTSVNNDDGEVDTIEGKRLE